MSRLRIEDGPGASFHFTARVNWALWYLNPEHLARLFTRVLSRCSEEFDFSLLGYVLMSNHFHFVGQSPPDREYRRRTTRRTKCRHRVPYPKHHLKATVISQFMHQLMWRSSRLIQAELKLKGHFWEESFHATRLRDGTHLVAALAYDHLNPVRQGMARTPEQYGRSSASWWAGTGESAMELLRWPVPFDLEVAELRQSLLTYQAHKQFPAILQELQLKQLWIHSEEGQQELRRLLVECGLPLI